MSAAGTKKRASWIEGFKYAFGIGYAEPPLSESDEAALMRVGDLVVSRRMEVPAIMALESLRPMNFLGSQVMVMLKPFVGIITDDTFWVSVQEAFEKRASVNFLIEYIEERMNERKRAERAPLENTNGDK
ncbi:MAG: hypothetical protein HRF49_05435 [bacterium]